MPTFIDSLLLEIGLDNSTFLKGAKETQESMKKTREEMERHGKGIEEAGKKASESIHHLLEKVLALYAVLIGAESIGSFIDRVTKIDTSTGRLSQSIQTSVTSVSELDKMAERFGGSGSAMNALLLKLNDSYYDLSVNGKALPIALSQIMSFSGKNIDFSHGPLNQLTDMSTAIQRIAKTRGTGVASYLARQMGADDPLVQMMIKYGPHLQEQMDKLKPLALTAEQVERAEAFEKAWVSMQQTATSFAHTFWTAVSPAISTSLEKLSAWFTEAKHQEWFNKKIEEFDGFVAGLPAKIDSLTGGIGKWIKANGGLEGAINKIYDASKLLLELWAGSKILAILSALAKFAPAVPVAVVAAGAFAESTPGPDPTAEQREKAKKDQEDYFKAHPEQDTWRNIKKWFSGETAPGEKKKESLGDWLSKKFISIFDMRAHAEGSVLGQNHTNTFGQLDTNAFNGTVKLEGREVNRGNPLPVWLMNAKAEEDQGALAAFQRNNGGGAGGANLHDAARRRLGGGGAAGAGIPEAETGPPVGSLAKDRERFAQELKNDPSLKRELFKHAIGENTGQTANLSIIESAMNRASLRHTSLRAQLPYFQGYREYDANAAKMMDRNLEKALAGSNASLGSTDNSSGGLAAREKANGTFRHHIDNHGESFWSPGNKEPQWARLYTDWAKRRGLDPSTGRALNTAPPTIPSIPRAPIGGGATPHTSGTPTSRNETHMNIASIVVHTRAKDAHGIAANIKEAMRRELHTRSQEGGLA